jgi:hypothetical protein
MSECKTPGSSACFPQIPARLDVRPVLFIAFDSHHRRIGCAVQAEGFCGDLPSICEPEFEFSAGLIGHMLGGHDEAVG